MPPLPPAHSRHDRGFSQEGLGGGIVLDALDSNFVPSVISQHYVCGERVNGSLALAGPQKSPAQVACPLQLTSKLSFPDSLQQLQIFHVQRPATCEDEEGYSK